MILHLGYIVIGIAVLSLRCKGISEKILDKLGKALSRFMKEDPTFHVRTDEESGETVISGMGELHLEVYIERIEREYGVALEVGPPQVNYREAITAKGSFERKQKIIAYVTRLK